jgi:NCS1 family nucleobase:cation symporter-1
MNRDELLGSPNTPKKPGLITSILPRLTVSQNDDIRPVDARHRTWGFLAVHNFCMVLLRRPLTVAERWLIRGPSGLLTTCDISSYLTGSLLIPIGLTW